MIEDSQGVENAISSRKTVKLLSDTPGDSNLGSAVIDSLLSTASWAPFHRPAAKVHQENSKLTSKVPWRFYVLDGPTCRALREQLIQAGDKTKIPKMLATAATLVQVTWLPNPKTNNEAIHYDPTLENMEHIAAASAAVQNLLIAATARGIETYWSSGGGLRRPENLTRLGIPNTEILLGSIFLFTEAPEGSTATPGKLRDERGDVSSWARWVELATENQD